ncbi:hypothetical protein L1887_10462 [Cichorium endivia]|nr:hypothetical protein L1887_10462 [Cichorium endivia]
MAFGSNITYTKSQQVRFLASSGTNPDQSNKFRFTITFRQTHSLQFQIANNISLLPKVHCTQSTLHLLFYTSLLTGDSTNEASPFLLD